MNITLYPWFKFCQSLTFWQATWFLYFQNELSGAQAILLYAIYDISTTVMEVPSGYLSDRMGRRITLLISAICGVLSMILLSLGGVFYIFALAQILLGASSAFMSGTDSSMLYESLAEEGREAEIEGQELRAWRFTFAALAISAVTGGFIAQYSEVVPFLASGVALFVSFLIVSKFREPQSDASGGRASREVIPLKSLKTALGNPVLAWLFVLSLLMYAFSHIPFVFGQPFILQALAKSGLEANATWVSGVITAAMMVISLGTSLLATRLRHLLGLTALLLAAFALQIFLSLVLAATAHVIVMAFLLLRMVPDSLSKPFIIARIQPLIENETRATYLSLQSLCGRILFALTLFAASTTATEVGVMSHAEIRSILMWYVMGGALCLLALALFATRISIENATDDPKG